MVLRCYPGQCLELHGVLLCVVTSPLLRIVTGHRVVICFTTQPLVNFIIKSMDMVFRFYPGCGVQVLSQTILEEVVLVVIFKAIITKSINL